MIENNASQLNKVASMWVFNLVAMKKKCSLEESQWKPSKN